MTSVGLPMSCERLDNRSFSARQRDSAVLFFDQFNRLDAISFCTTALATILDALLFLAQRGVGSQMPN